jgi:hypothetical protein
MSLREGKRYPQPQGAATREYRHNRSPDLFIFDPVRQMVLLIAGDKANNWQGWYKVAIPLAEARYAEHLAALNEEGE